MIPLATRALAGVPPALLLLCLSSASAVAQGGYVTEKHPELGLVFSRARDYEAIPIQPGEEWTVLYYAEKEAFNPRMRKSFRPELRFVWIEHTPELAAPAGPLPAEVEGEEELGPIDDFESYAEQKLTRWTLGAPVAARARSDNQALEYKLVFESGSGVVFGRAFTYSNEERTIAVYGFCAAEDEREQLKIWRKMLGKIKFSEREERDDSKLLRYYSRLDYEHVDYRIDVRNQLVKGWKAEDSENYILVYSTKDEPLIRLIKSELEAIRREYVKLFPPAREITAVSTVRICKDESEYRKYGGSAGSAGYWSAQTEELVFYDAEDDRREAGSGKADTRIVLYHEAFHQYIFYAVGQVDPHSWFNEGTGDYFSGALIKGGKVRKIGANPWRAAFIKKCAAGEDRYPSPISFGKILGFSQAEFYQPDRAGLCYAQAWSMVYFLRTAPEVRKHKRWSRILDTYFDTLKERFAEELGQADPAELDTETLDTIKELARDAAREKAFQEIDLVELEEAWREYIGKLKIPR